MKRLAIATLGCKTNSYESAAIASAFPEGFELVDFSDDADVYVVNTCTVTGRTDFKSRNLIRKALARKALDPSVKVVVTGCFAQRHPMEVAALGPVDLIVDNQSKAQIWNLLKGAANEFHDASEADGFVYTPVTSMLERSRAFQKIQDGCGLFCAYCAVSYARGPSRSARKEDVLAQAELFVANGYKEIVLGGVNLGLYQDNGLDLADLLHLLKKVPGLELIRLSSLEPQLVSVRLLEELASDPIFCPHLHLSLQSGSETVLRRMGRRYGAADFMGLITRIKAVLPDAAVGADVIVGFPGETESEFEQTVALIRELPMAYLHVFSYSKRPGTPAARMPDQIPGPVKKQRSSVLTNLAKDKTNHYINMLIDSQIPIRGVVEAIEGGTATLLSDHYIRAYTSDPVKQGELICLVPVQPHEDGLTGRRI